MKTPHSLRGLFGAAGLCALAAVGGYAGGATAHGKGEEVTPIFVQRLETVPGKSLTAMTVDYEPGGASRPHHHPKQAEVFVYVVSGAVRSKVNDGPEAVYHAGEFWYEPPGAAHGVSANASATEPARLLAVVVADAGISITTDDR